MNMTCSVVAVLLQCFASVWPERAIERWRLRRLSGRSPMTDRALQLKCRGRLRGRLR